MRDRTKGLLLAVLAPVAFFAPTLAGGSGAVYSAFVLIAIFASMAYGLDLIVSDLGEVSLAHTVFFAVGSYTTALLATRAGAGGWTTLAAAIVAALVFALLMGLVTLRLREFVFSLVTYAIAVVELEEGPRMMTNIIDCPQTPEALVLDMPLEVAFVPMDDSISLPLFRPAKGS